MGLFDDWLGIGLDQLARLAATDDDEGTADVAGQWISVLVLFDSTEWELGPSDVDDDGRLIGPYSRANVDELIAEVLKRGIEEFARGVADETDVDVWTKVEFFAGIVEEAFDVTALKSAKMQEYCCELLRNIPVKTKVLLPDKVAVMGEFSLVTRIAAELVADNDGVFKMERVRLGGVELETVGSGPDPP